MENTIKIPGSTSNFGPGFDCLGAAINLYSETTFRSDTDTLHEPDGSSIELVYEDSHKPDVPHNKNLIIQSIVNLFRMYERRIPSIALNVRSQIPPSRGIGSSAVAILTGTTIALRIIQDQFSKDDICTSDQILKHAYALEGHHGNLHPCLYGGIRIMFRKDDGPASTLVPVEDLPDIYLVVPSIEYETNQARDCLPDLYSPDNVIYNLPRTALFVKTLMTGDWETLQEALSDKLHQPHRIPQLPGGYKIPKACLEAGGYGVWLSGAGPSYGCFVARNDQRPPQAMKKEFEKHDTPARIIQVDIDSNGVLM